MYQERIAVDCGVNSSSLKVDLEEGFAECMGDGLFVLFQTAEDGAVHSLTLTRNDLKKLLSTRY